MGNDVLRKDADRANDLASRFAESAMRNLECGDTRLYELFRDQSFKYRAEYERAMEALSHAE